MANFLMTAGWRPEAAERESVRQAARLRPFFDLEEAEHGAAWMLRFHPGQAGRYPALERGGKCVWVLGELVAEDLPAEATAGYVLDRFEREGPESLNHHNGNYTVVVWEVAAGRLTIGNDMVGYQPIYYSELPGGLTIASKLFALTRLGGLGSGLDAQAVHDYFFTGWIMDGRTLLADVRRLMPGSLLTWQDGRLETQRRAMPVFTREHWGQTQTGLADMMFERLDVALRRRAASGGATLVPLSGGLDSRVLAGFYRKYAPGALTTLTYGQGYHGDMIAARAVACQLGVEHVHRPFGRDYMVRYADDHCHWIEGQADPTTAQIFPAADFGGGRFAEIALGSLGGPLTGHSIDASKIGVDPDPVRCFERLMLNFSLPGEELDRFLTARFTPEVRAESREIMWRMFHENESAEELFQKLTHVDLPTYQHAFIFSHHAACNTAARSVAPLLDREFMNLMFGTSPAQQEGQVCYRKMLVRHFPELARLINANDHRPIANDKRAVANLFRYLARKAATDKPMELWTRLRGRVSPAVVSSMWDAMSWPDYHGIAAQVERMFEHEAYWADWIDRRAVREGLDAYIASKGLKHRVMMRRLMGFYRFLERFLA